MRYHAVVLRSKHNMVALLDAQLGRIDCGTSMGIVSAGTLISYQLPAIRRRPWIIDAQIENSPLHVAQHDILFLHHVLELCYTCIPVGSCAHGVFSLLQRLYCGDHMVFGRQYKKLFLYALLSCLGVGSSDYQISSTSSDQLETVCMDTFIEESLHIESEKELDTWLQLSMAEYINMNELKTIHFLTQSRVV